MQFFDVPFGTTASPKHDNVHYYDAPGGKQINVLRGETYDVIVRVDDVPVNGKPTEKESWYGISGPEKDLVRFCRAAGLKDIEVTHIDYNSVVDAMVQDIFGKVTALMETNTDGR